MGTKLSLLQKSGQGRRLGWQPPKQTITENTTSAINTRAQIKTPSNFELPKAPKLTESQPRDTNWQESKSDKNLQAMGSRDGKTEH